MEVSPSTSPSAQREAERATAPLTTLTPHPSYCVHDGYMATPPTRGTMARLVLCPAANVVPLPACIGWAASGCIQPLAVAVQIARRAGALASRSVAVVGCGPLGLLTLALARAHGARTLVAIDVNPAHADFARTYVPGVRAFVMPPLAQAQEQGQGQGQEQGQGQGQLQAHCEAFAAHVVQAAGAAHAHGLDVVVEASGAESAVVAGLHLLRHGGTYVQAGLAPGGAGALTLFPTFALADRELTIRGSLRYTAGCFEDAIALVASGAVDPAPLVTRTVPLSRVEDAFDAFASGHEIKVVIMNQE